MGIINGASGGKSRWTSGLKDHRRKGAPLEKGDTVGTWRTVGTRTQCPQGLDETDNNLKNERRRKIAQKGGDGKRYERNTMLGLVKVTRDCSICLPFFAGRHFDWSWLNLVHNFIISHIRRFECYTVYFIQAHYIDCNQKHNLNCAIK